MQKKTCSKCKNELLLKKFYPSKNGKFGTYSVCKDCVKKKRTDKNKAEYDIIYKALEGIKWEKMF